MGEPIGLEEELTGIKIKEEVEEDVDIELIVLQNKKEEELSEDEIEGKFWLTFQLYLKTTK